MGRMRIECRTEALSAMRLAPHEGQKPRRLQLKVRGRPGKLLMVTGLTLNTQEAMFKTTALQKVVKLPDNVFWKIPLLLRQHALEPGPVFLDQLTKQHVLWLMSLISEWANGPEVELRAVRGCGLFHSESTVAGEHRSCS